MARYHRPNPLDALFLAIDEAWRRCGLWGADIHLYLETGGEVDVDGLRDAVRCLHRLYPATAGRLVRPMLNRTPAWRLDVEPPDVERVVTVERVERGTEEALRARLDELLAGRLDLAVGPPLRLYVLRGLPAGDVVVIRWPHALMDARGGEHIIREIARLYDEKPDAGGLASLGDEERGDFGTLTVPSLGKAFKQFRQKGESSSPPPSGSVSRLPDANICTGDECQRVFVRRISVEEFAQIRTVATQVCGFARVGDFIRACAIRALHETVAEERQPVGGYSTLHLLENRRRRDPGPVCHNIFTTMPMFIPAEIADDRRTVADLIQQTAATMIEPGVMERQLAGVRLLPALGTNTLAREMARGMRTGKSRLPVGLVESPSLPMGFMNLFTEPLRRFCGAEFVNLFGLRAASPIAGLGVNVCTVNDRLNISGVHIEPHVDREAIERFLDLFAGYLLDAGG